MLEPLEPVLKSQLAAPLTDFSCIHKNVTRGKCIDLTAPKQMNNRKEKAQYMQTNKVLTQFFIINLLTERDRERKGREPRSIL